MSARAPQPPARRIDAARVGLVAIALVVVVAALVFAAGLIAIARPDFYSRYDGLKRRVTTLESSKHAGIACERCHADDRGAIVHQASLVGDFYRSLVGTPPYWPSYVSFAAPTRESCLSCHRYDWSDEASRTNDLPHPAHLRVATETRNCVDCHKWVAHEELYAEKHMEMPFSTVCASYLCHSGTKSLDECKSCHHALQESLGSWKEIHPQTVRQSGPNGCLEKCHTVDQCEMCHTTGRTPSFATSASPPGVRAIEREHVKKDWIDKHGTFSIADPAKCRICHVSDGECQDCHAIRPKFHGDKSTWLTRHKDFAKDERRCLACHEKPWCEECHKQFKEMQ